MQLKKLINHIESPETIVYLDEFDICGRNLVWSHVNSHLDKGRSVHYLCYSINPVICSQVLNNDGAKNIILYDLHSDPLGWEADSSSKQSKRGKEPFIKHIDFSLSTNEKIVVVIDKLSCALNFLSETTLLRSLIEVKNAESVLQVIVYCNQDVISPSFIAALTNLSPCIVSLNPTIPSSCNVLLKKKSGKIVKSIEEFSVNERLSLEFAKEINKSKFLQKNSSSESRDSVFETTFNLSLTEDQKEAKNKLILPHTRIQASGGHIHYVPEAEDDWDDEDPDEDLEI